MNDIHASTEYRANLVKVMAKRAVAKAKADAQNAVRFSPVAPSSRAAPHPCPLPVILRPFDKLRARDGERGRGRCDYSFVAGAYWQRLAKLCGRRYIFAMNRDTSPTQSSESASVAFIDLAGFSAIADVYGDAAAINILEIFESKVREALAGYEPPIKWIGDEAMLSFPEPELAIQALGTLLLACREEPRLPLTRSALNHGPVIRRANDIFGSTVNIAARMASLASPGQLLATQPVAEAAAARGILIQDLGKVALRSVAEEVPLYEIGLAPSPDPAWIDPVCKMHAPYASYRRAAPEGPWFCSPRCEEAYRKSPQTYPLPR